MGGCMCLCICTYTYSKVVHVKILMGIACRTSVLHMCVLRLRYVVVSFLYIIQSSPTKLSSKDTATGESEYVYVTNMRARPAPKVGTPRPPHYYNTPHTAAGQQRQQHRDELQSSPRLPRAVNREEHTYINVPAAAHTEVCTLILNRYYSIHLYNCTV